MWIHTQSTVPLTTSNMLFWFIIQITTNCKFNSIKLNYRFWKNHQPPGKGLCYRIVCCSCWVLNYLGDPLLLTWIIIIVTDTDSCRLSLATMSRVWGDISFSQCEPHPTICHDIFCCTLPFECNAQRPPEKKKRKEKVKRHLGIWDFKCHLYLSLSGANVRTSEFIELRVCFLLYKSADTSGKMEPNQICVHLKPSVKHHDLRLPQDCLPKAFWVQQSQPHSVKNNRIKHRWGELLLDQWGNTGSLVSRLKSEPRHTAETGEHGHSTVSYLKKWRIN